MDGVTLMDNETQSAGALMAAAVMILIVLACVGAAVLLYWLTR